MTAILFVVALISMTDRQPASTQTWPPKIAVESYGEESRRQIREALEEARSRPNDAVVAGRLGMILHAYEEYESAETCYGRALQLAPDLKWAYLQGLIKVRLGQPAEALKSFREVERLKPDYWPARFRMAEIFLGQGRLNECQALLTALVAEQGQSALVHYNIGRVLAAQRDFRAAAAAYRQAVTLSPFFGAAHYGLAMASRETGARDELARHLRLSQEHRLVRPFLSDPIEQEMQSLNLSAASHLRKGVEYESAGRLDEAIREHERALEINPGFEQVRLNLFTLYARSGQLEKADTQYRALNELNPNLAESHFNYGVMKVGMKQFVAARDAFLRCLAANNYHPQAHFNLGRVMEIEERYDDALGHYSRAVEYAPSWREARYELARMLIYKEKLPAAIEVLEQALTPVDSQTPRYLYALAIANARRGEREKAIGYMRRAREQAIQYRANDLLVAIERDLKTLESK